MACHSGKTPQNADTRRAYEVQCTLAHLQYVNCCNLETTLVEKFVEIKKHFVRLGLLQILLAWT